MPINPLVLELLEKAAESGLTAEEVCRDRPDLIAEVRACLRQLSSVRDELDALFPEDDELAPPKTSAASPEIPGYSVGDVVGRGGMGVVYRAHHLRLKRQVAVKMMLSGGFAGPPELARFEQEAEALAALQHPNIVQVHDVGESGGLPYFAMEYIDGGNLAQKLGGVPVSAQAAACLMLQLADAIESAHRGGIVHRDLKPSNVLLTAAGTPKVTDFGLARRLEAGAGLSMTATRIGTPGYMAPEQLTGHSRVSGAATDVYSLGAILYEMLTGRPPFRAETASETERQVIAEEPAPPSRLNARVPRDLETICLKCLQKDPRRRYPSALEIGEDIGRFLRGEPIRARPVGSAERAGKWMRRHTTRTLAMFGALAIGIGLLAGGWWTLSARAMVRRAIEEDLRIAAQALRRSDWGEARSALERARGRLGRESIGELRRRLDQSSDDQELVGHLAAIRLDRLSRTGWGGQRSADEYEEAFRSAGLIEKEDEARVVAGRIVRSDVKSPLVAAVDDWALCANFIDDRRREAWLLEVARRADPDQSGWRDRLRDPAARRDRHELERRVGSVDLAETPVNLLASLGELLQRSGGDAIPFLTAVQRHHPDDLWVNYLLGRYAMDRNDNPEAFRNLQAALATRPNTPYLFESLGEVFHRAGREPEAYSYYAKAAELDPEDMHMRENFGNYLMELNRLPEATRQFERGLGLATDDAARSSFLRNLRECRVRLDELDDADALWKKTLELASPRHEDCDGYAELCLYRGRADMYRTACRDLIEHFGATEDAQIAERTGRACLLSPVSGEILGAATTLVDRALAGSDAKPAWVRPYLLFAKGLAEYRNGRLGNAMEILDGPASRVLQAGPGLVSAMARHRSGRQEDALGAFAAAVLKTDWRESRVKEREQWVYHVLRREAEAMMLPNLRAFLDGQYQPRSLEERVCLLGACQFEGHYKKAAEIYTVMLASDRPLNHDPGARTNYLAACAAASTGAGRGRDCEVLDEAERWRWRKQARDWLRADLALTRKHSGANPGELRTALRTILGDWREDPDLAGLRDAAVCKGLSHAEQTEFQVMCDNLRALIVEARD